jgi:IstB-like ATP binding protein
MDLRTATSTGARLTGRKPRTTYGDCGNGSSRRHGMGTSGRSAACRSSCFGLALEAFDDTTESVFDRQLWSELTTLRFVDDVRDLIIAGPVGVGKTFMASALGHIAVRRHYSVLMVRADQALKRLRASRLDGTHDAVQVDQDSGGDHREGATRSDRTSRNPSARCLKDSALGCSVNAFRLGRLKLLKADEAGTRLPVARPSAKIGLLRPPAFVPYPPRRGGGRSIARFRALACHRVPQCGYRPGVDTFQSLTPSAKRAHPPQGRSTISRLKKSQL